MAEASIAPDVENSPLLHQALQLTVKIPANGETPRGTEYTEKVSAHFFEQYPNLYLQLDLFRLFLSNRKHFQRFIENVESFDKQKVSSEHFDIVLDALIQQNLEKQQQQNMQLKQQTQRFTQQT